MKVIFPDNCTTEASRLSFCYRLEQLLYNRRNLALLKYRRGELTKEQMLLIEREFEKRLNILATANLRARREAMRGEMEDGTKTPWNPDPDKDIVVE